MTAPMIRFGLIGCGEISVLNIQAINEAPRTEVTATFDVDPELARDMAEKAGGARVARTQEELLAAGDVDAVMIATPHFLHEPITLAALEAGKHVLVEKPIACTTEQGRRMVDAADRAGLRLGVIYHLRYGSQVPLMRKLISGGRLGRLMAWEVLCWVDKHASYWGGGYSQRSKSDWRTRWATAGGGLVIMNFSHYIDRFRLISGQEVVEVKAAGGTLGSPEGVEVEDTISAALTLSDGGVGVLGGCSAVPGGHAYSERIIGAKGHIRITRESTEVFLNEAAEVDGLSLPAGEWTVLPQPYESPSQTARQCLIEAFADWVLGGDEFLSTGGDALRTLEVCEKIYDGAGLRQGVNYGVY